MANVEELLIKLSVDNAELKAKLNESETKVKGFGDTTKKVSAMAVAGWAAVGATAGMLVREIFNVTASFQKYNAVLTNTLGSSGAAASSMAMIKEFAAKTPFSVDQLTSAFVKLANQGFTPTADQMRSLGDLASSTGKDFDMLAEAVIDASTGEFERLKEFGIKAKTEGDKVSFTFKGITTQVANTSESIRDYILSLGNAQGVSGAMAAISETLGGKLSNLGDSWDTLLVTLGDQTSGIFGGVISWMTSLISKATEVIKSARQLRAEMLMKNTGTAIGAAQENIINKGNIAEVEKKDLPAYYKNQLAAYIAISKAEEKRLTDLQAQYELQTKGTKGVAQTQSYWNVIQNIIPDISAKIQEQKNFQDQLTASVFTTIAALEKVPIINTPPKGKKEKADKKDDFAGKIIGLPTSVESYAQLTDAKIKEDERFAKENTKLLTELEKQEEERMAASDAAYSASFEKRGEITAAFTAKAASDMLSFWEEMRSEEGINMLTDSVINLSMAFIDMAAAGELSIKNMVNATLGGIKQIIQALLAKAIASTIAHESSKGLVGLAFAAVGIGVIQGLFNKYAKFADGGIAGIVPGSSYTGDKIHAALNSGEAVLNTRQQANFMDMANGKFGGSGGKLQVEVVGVISGDTIRLVNKRSVYLNERKGY